MPRRKSAQKVKSFPAHSSETQIREIINLRFQSFINKKMSEQSESGNLDVMPFFRKAEDRLTSFKIAPKTSEIAKDTIKELRIHLATKPASFMLSIGNVFKLFDVYSRTFNLADEGTINELYMVFRYLQSHIITEQNVRYDKYISTYTNLCQTVTKIIARDVQPYGFNSRYIDDGGQPRQDVNAEAQIIKALAAFEMPMDFVYTASKDETAPHLASVLNMMQSLFERAHAFFEDKNRDIHPKNYQTILTGLEHLNYEFDDALYATVQSLIKTIIDRGFVDAQNNTSQWTAEDLSRFVRSNAILGLKKDGHFEPVLCWDNVYEYLTVIAYKITDTDDSDQPSPITVKVLAQIYAAYYPDHKIRQDKPFPKALKHKIDTFVKTFSETTHGSIFEDKLFKQSFPKAIESLKETYPYINWQKCLNFDNPITDFGLETDILFTHAETGLQVPIQIDGFKYHTYNAINEANRTVNKRTRFRDFNFRNFGLMPIIISDKGNAEMFRKQIFDLMRDKVVYQVQNKLHQQRHQQMQDNLNSVDTVVKHLQHMQTALAEAEQAKQSESDKINILKRNLATYASEIKPTQIDNEITRISSDVDNLENQIQQTLAHLDSRQAFLMTQLSLLTGASQKMKEQVAQYGACYQTDFAANIKEMSDVISKNKKDIQAIDGEISCLYEKNKRKDFDEIKRQLKQTLEHSENKLKKINEVVRADSSIKVENYLEEIILLSNLLPDNKNRKDMTPALIGSSLNKKMKKKLSALVHGQLSKLPDETLAKIRQPISNEIGKLKVQIEQVNNREKQTEQLKQQKSTLLKENKELMVSRKAMRDKVRKVDLNLPISKAHRQLFKKIETSLTLPESIAMPDYMDKINELAKDLDAINQMIEDAKIEAARQAKADQQRYSPTFFARPATESITNRESPQPWAYAPSGMNDYPTYLPGYHPMAAMPPYYPIEPYDEVPASDHFYPHPDFQAAPFYAPFYHFPSDVAHHEYPPAFLQENYYTSSEYGVEDDSNLTVEDIAYYQTLLEEPSYDYGYSYEQRVPHHHELNNQEEETDDETYTQAPPASRF